MGSQLQKSEVDQGEWLCKMRITLCKPRNGVRSSSENGRSGGTFHSHQQRKCLIWLDNQRTIDQSSGAGMPRTVAYRPRLRWYGGMRTPELSPSHVQGSAFSARGCVKPTGWIPTPYRTKKRLLWGFAGVPVIIFSSTHLEVLCSLRQWSKIFCAGLNP